MKFLKSFSRMDSAQWGAIVLPLILFWVVLFIRIPTVFSQYFHPYSFWVFITVPILFWLAFRLSGKVQTLASLGLTMALFALSLSYIWSSGWSDNGIIGGLLPYKDPKNYYFGANLILYGLPVQFAQQATERPLFPAFLASLLFLTGQNMKITVAIIAQLMGVSLYAAARQVRNSFGVLAAGVFVAQLYSYTRPWIGYLMSETVGFALGCLGFALILYGATRIKWFDLIVGMIILFVAVSARAGTFLIFPMLVLWAGWVMRGEKRYSLKVASGALIILLAGFFLINSIYSRLLGIPFGSSFGNFSYALYGQVHGGTGWNSAIADLKTREPAVVYRATFQYFLAHPTHLFIGFAKAYWDFFKFGGIYTFRSNDVLYRLNMILWLLALALTARGVFRLLRDIRSNPSSLLLAAFIGFVLSIAFLPPGDGGTRFYAGSVPFFFVVEAVGLSGLTKRDSQPSTPESDSQAESILPRFLSLAVLALVFVIPLGLYWRGHKPAHELPVCLPKQKVFVMQPHPETYIHLVKPSSASCGFLPEVCLNDFKTNNTEKLTDHFYQQLFHLMEISPGNARVLPGFDLVAQRFHYYFISDDKLSTGSLPRLVAGCATQISTEDQSIFYVDSIEAQ